MCPKISIDIPSTMLQAIDERSDNRAAFIRGVLADKLGIPDTIATHGGNRKSNTPPDGWRSLLYRDRYQLVASHNGDNWYIEHLHEAGKLPDSYHHIVTLREDSVYPNDGRKIEVDVYMLSPKPRDKVATDLRFALQEWFGVQEDSI